MAELADAQDLKFCGSKDPSGFEARPRQSSQQLTGYCQPPDKVAHSSGALVICAKTVVLHLVEPVGMIERLGNPDERHRSDHMLSFP